MIPYIFWLMKVKDTMIFGTKIAFTTKKVFGTKTANGVNLAYKITLLKCLGG